MAYLEKKLDTARDMNKPQTEEENQKQSQELSDSFEEGSVIEKAMKKFLGGFKELKSEISMIKESVKSYND